MAERSKKISELTALTNASGDDLLPIVDQPGTANAATLKITVSNLFGNVNTNTVFKQVVTANNTYTTKLYLNTLANAPATAAANGTAGEIRLDTSYIYVCTANNTWKRSALSTW